MSLQAVFSSNGSIKPSKCVKYGIKLGNYGYWEKGEGPLCCLCFGVPPRVGGKEK